MMRAVSEVNHVGTSRTCWSSPAWASQGTWGPNRSIKAVTKAGRNAREEKMPIEPRPWISSGRLMGVVPVAPGPRDHDSGGFWRAMSQQESCAGHPDMGIVRTGQRRGQKDQCGLEPGCGLEGIEDDRIHGQGVVGVVNKSPGAIEVMSGYRAKSAPSNVRMCASPRLACKRPVGRRGPGRHGRHR